MKDTSPDSGVIQFKKPQNLNPKNMSQTKHTAGPWTAKFEHSNRTEMCHYEIQYGTDGECVAEIVHKEEDAKLIAASPDLLKALIEIEGEQFDDDVNAKQLFEIIDRIKVVAYEAIKKATS